MAVSFNQAAKIGLTPGSEFVQRRSSNMAWAEFYKRVRYERNSIYFGVVLTTIAIAGAALSVGNQRVACTTVATLSGGLTTFAVKRLFDSIAFLQQALNTFSVLSKK